MTVTKTKRIDFSASRLFWDITGWHWV